MNLAYLAAAMISVAAPSESLPPLMRPVATTAYF